MTDSRENLIQDLAADLKPVERPGRVGLALVLWAILASAYSVIVVVSTGPLREGALANLVAVPTFAIETLIAICAIIGLAHATLRTALPGVVTSGKDLVLPFALLAAWIGVYVIGLEYPAHPVSMLGKRDHCIWQAVLFSLPSMALMLWMARRLLPLRPRTTGALAGAASAAIPGALMQFGCMYVPQHILTHHIGPIFIVAALGLLVGRLALDTRRIVPRKRNASIH